MWFFILTDLYCRIYPMLVIAAYTKQELGSKPLLLPSVMAGVFLLVFTYEFIAYRFILHEGYNVWIVIKQLYFATFTISFFLLSALGLAYLEKNVHFKKLMEFEFRWRMAIGLMFVMTVLVHQTVFVGIEHHDEWHF